MQRWEYCYYFGGTVMYCRTGRRVNIDSKMDALTTLGNEGWELVAVFENQLYFKRPL